MEKVYECDVEKNKELTQILEKDPYAEDSFSRKGYKTKEGAAVGLDEKKVYLYISADEGFMKKADEKLKGVCTPAKKEDAEKVIGVIKAEEDQATSGFGGIFGE